MLRTTSTRLTYNESGPINVQNIVRIIDVINRSAAAINDIGSDAQYIGTTEIIVQYIEVDENGNERELQGNEYDQRIVRPLQIADEYLATLDQSLFNGLTGGARLNKRGYFFLRKHLIDISLFGIVDINEWEYIG